MIQLFTNKNFIKKILIAVMAVTLFNFCFMPSVQAKSSLVQEIEDLTTVFADVFASLLQYAITGEWVYVVDDSSNAAKYGKDATDNFWVKSKNIKYPIMQISPELIFGNKIELLDTDFISPDSSGKDYIIETKIVDNNGKNILREGRKELRNIIASWYITLRTIAAVGLLSVLLYVGIRIILSSTSSSDKAKYKERLLDWLVAFCLLFFMHYIMAAMTSVINRVDNVLAPIAGIGEGISLDENRGYIIYNAKKQINSYEIKRIDGDIDNKEQISETISKAITEWFNKKSNESSIYKLDPNAPEHPIPGTGNGDDYVKNTYIYKVNGKNTVTLYARNITSIGPNTSGTYWEISNDDLSDLDFVDLIKYLNPNINTSGMINNINEVPNNYGVIKLTLNGKDIIVSKDSITDGSKILYFINYARLYVNANDANQTVSLAFLVLYIMLLSFTISFALRYAKRLIYIAFLTLMAPLVALTYPLDKIKDRKSSSIRNVA